MEKTNCSEEPTYNSANDQKFGYDLEKINEGALYDCKSSKGDLALVGVEFETNEEKLQRYEEFRKHKELLDVIMDKIYKLSYKVRTTYQIGKIKNEGFFAYILFKEATNTIKQLSIKELMEQYDKVKKI